MASTATRPTLAIGHAPFVFLLFVLTELFGLSSPGYAAELSASTTSMFPRPLTDYHDEISSVIGRLVHRAEVEPFNIIATLIFFCAIVHTFLTAAFTKMGTGVRCLRDSGTRSGNRKDRRSAEG